MSYKIILLLFLTLIGCSVYGQYTESRKVERAFKVDPSTSLEITNKYGRIHIVNWDKDSVKISIALKAESTSRSKLKKVIKTVDFDFISTDDFIIVESQFKSTTSSFFQELKNLTESLIPSGDEVTINYMIKVPKYLNVKLTNKYGDIYMDEIDGEFELDLSYGDLKVNSINGRADITAKQGNLNIRSFKEGILNLSYVDLRVRNAQNMKLTSRSSKINIEKIKFLRINTRRDKVYIDEMDQLYGSTYFSDMWVYNQFKKVNLKMKYGGLNMENIDKDFSLVNIYSENTDLNLFFDNRSSYQLDVKHVDTNFNYPKDLAQLKKELLDDDENIYNTFGTIGKSKAQSKVEITAKKCSLNISHK